jgi:cell division protein FtsL
MKIKAKIFGGFLTIIILLFAGAFITVFQFVKLNHNNRQLLDENKQYSSAMYNQRVIKFIQ